MADQMNDAPAAPLAPRQTLDIVPPRATPDAAALAQLWADQFQHMTTLALAAGGGLLITLESGMVQRGPRWWTTLILCAATALLSMLGQTIVVDDATGGIPPGRAARICRNIGMMLLGSSAYMLGTLFL